MRDICARVVNEGEGLFLLAKREDFPNLNRKESPNWCLTRNGSPNLDL